ncbi:hypothetical protein H4582DRAFT_2056780 [Lactarius indigo]|nr:hypothetical protein H4582DRAFT_2056780 [Lactarius indigo]
MNHGLRSRRENDWRDTTFRWIAQSLQTILDPRPIIERTTWRTEKQTTWPRGIAPLDPAWKKRTQNDRVDRSFHDGPLLFEFPGKVVTVVPSRSAARTADGSVEGGRPETKDLMWKAVGYFLVFLDCLKWLGEVALNTGSGKEKQVAMDIDLPPKRQRIGDNPSTSLSAIVLRTVPSAVVPPWSTSTPQRASAPMQQQQASHFPTPPQRASRHSNRCSPRSHIASTHEHGPSPDDTSGAGAMILKVAESQAESQAEVEWWSEEVERDYVCSTVHDEVRELAYRVKLTMGAVHVVGLSSSKPPVQVCTGEQISYFSEGLHVSEQYRNKR